MNKKQIASHVEAMMCASGLNPNIEDDYFENIDGVSLVRLLLAINNFFRLEEHYKLGLHQLRYIDSPSEFITYMQNHSGCLSR